MNPKQYHGACRAFAGRRDYNPSWDRLWLLHCVGDVAKELARVIAGGGTINTASLLGSLGALYRQVHTMIDADKVPATWTATPDSWDTVSELLSFIAAKPSARDLYALTALLKLDAEFIAARDAEKTWTLKNT